MREPDMRDDFADYAGTLRELANGQAKVGDDAARSPEAAQWRANDVAWHLNTIADALDKYAAALGEGYPNAMQGIALARLIRGFDPNGTATTTVRKAGLGLPDGYISAQVAELSEPTRTPFTCGIAPDGSSSS